MKERFSMEQDHTALQHALQHILCEHKTWVPFESLCREALAEVGRKKLTAKFKAAVEEALWDDSIEPFSLFRPSKSDSDGEYIGRGGFFQGSRFLVNLTEVEKREKILIPGHRFVPFLRPPKYVLGFDLLFRGRPLPTREVRLPLPETAG